MRARLKVTIQRLKHKALATTKQRRLLQAQLKRRERRIASLEAENELLRTRAAPLKIKGHTYPAQLVALAVFIVVHGHGSLRCAAKTVGFVAQLLGWSYPTPSHTSVRRWVLRLGLYQFQHTKNKAGNYVALLDESIQIGREKLLLMLGVKLAQDRSHCAPLTGAEVEVLGLEVRQSWTGECVADFIRGNLKRLPKVRIDYFVTDGGTNLTKALKILGLEAVADCTHVMMNALKKLLADDPVLSRLSADIGTLRRQLMLTAEGFLLPPTLRDKDRFLRIFTIVHWVERIDAMWANLPLSSRQKLHFIQGARPQVRCMAQLKALVELTAQTLKGAGLSRVTQQRWEGRVKAFSNQNQLTQEAQVFIEKLRAYFAHHHTLVEKHTRLLCCTDIIESTFGRYKNKGGTPTISADVLAIALYGLDLTPGLVQKALTALPYQTVQEWQNQHVCENRYAIVRRMNQELKSVVT
jgi:hypothetical protein